MPNGYRGGDKAHSGMVKIIMPDVFKREMQKGRYDNIYNTGGRAKGKTKKLRETKGKELQLIRGHWLLIQYQKSKRRNMSEKIE